MTKYYLDLNGTGYLWDKIKTALNAKADASRVSALEEKHASGKTVAQEVADGISALNLSNTYASKSVVTTLIGSDTGKSARTIANEELVSQLIPANAIESLNTLNEIAAWIQSHPGDVATINAAIAALQNKLTLGIDSTTSEEYATVQAYIESMTADLLNNMHTHNNKAILDNISSTDITAWNNAVSTIAALDTYIAITTAEIDNIVNPSND